jgi:hypothetical protein
MPSSINQKPAHNILFFEGVYRLEELGYELLRCRRFLFDES